MAKDFRQYLEESDRSEDFGRFFKEIGIGSKIVASIQASSVHDCSPAETLDDLKAYETWEVALRQTNRPIYVTRVGVWEHLYEKDWAKDFEQPDFGRFLERVQMPTAEVQTMFDDLVSFALENDQLEKEEDIHMVDPDEPIKKIDKNRKLSCGGCQSK
jgi:hypothetical protein